MPPSLSATAVRGSEFTPLLRGVRSAGLLERRTGWYARSIALNLLLLAATWTGVVLLGGSWWVLALALPAAVLGGRTAFVGHELDTPPGFHPDLSHRAHAVLTGMFGKEKALARQMVFDFMKRRLQ